MRKHLMAGALLIGALLLATASWGSHLLPAPNPVPQSVSPYWDPSVPLPAGKEGSVGDTVWVRVKDDSSCSFTGQSIFGGRGVRAPSWAYWCFDGGVGDSCSNTTLYNANTASNRIPGCWTHYDVHIFGGVNRWHINTYDVYQPGTEDSSYWCGEIGDPNTWDWPPGYGPGYGFSLVLNLGNTAGFSTADGMTLGGVHVYAVELSYDYCFVEMASSGITDTALWVEIGRYNGMSNPDSANCRGLGASVWGDGIGGTNQADSPYLCADWTTFALTRTATQMTNLGRNGTENLFIRWRVYSDFLWDDVTDGGTESDTRGAWRLDHVYAKGDNSGSSQYFPAGGAGTRGGDQGGAADHVDFESSAEDGFSAFSAPLLPGAEASGGYWNGSNWIHGKSKIVDLWHLTNAPTYPNQGQTCETSNRWVWASNLTPAGVDGNIEDNAWFMRLVSPVFDVSPTSPLTAGTVLAGERITGNIIVMDSYICTKQVSQDITDTKIHFYEGPPVNAWNAEWKGDQFVRGGTCTAWSSGLGIPVETLNFDDWSEQATAFWDSIQYGFDFWDQCNYNSPVLESCYPGAFVTNPHRKNTYIMDNFAVGFFPQRGTIWALELFARFQDTFDRTHYIHPSTVMNDELFAADVRQDEDSLQVQIDDLDGIAENSLVMHYRVSTDCGSTWTHESSRPQGSKAKPAIEWFTKTLNFSVPTDPGAPPPVEFNGLYKTTIELNTTDLPGSILTGTCPSCSLRAGTVVEYYLTALDRAVSANADTFPNRHSTLSTFIHTLYGTERQSPWPLEVTVLPCSRTYAPQGNKRVLLANEFTLRDAYDPESDPALTGVSTQAFVRLSMLYEEALRDLNVKFDRYDNNTSNISRGDATHPFYTEPTDPDGFGGIREPSSATHRYEDVIWVMGRSTQNTVNDSSQLEVSSYLASDANEGNIWMEGNNTCEDETMSGTAEAFNSGNFWVNYVGANLIAGGCPDNAGLADRKFYIEGVNDADFTPFTLVGGWADCPIRDQPDNGFEINVTGQGTELIVFQFDNLAHTLNETSGILNTQPGAPNKALTTMFGLEHVSTRAARACVMRAVLTEFGVTLPAGSKYTSAICANSATDIGGTGGARKFDLAQNYPNPFNPSTKIRYALPKDNMKVQLSIFDVSGREVVKLVNRVESGADHEVLWNGKNKAGQDVASGVYFYKLKADNQEAVKKMVLLK